MSQTALSTYSKWTSDSSSFYQAIIDEQGRLLMASPDLINRFEDVWEANGACWFELSLRKADRKSFKQCLREASGGILNTSITYFHADNELEAITWNFQVAGETENIQFLCTGRVADFLADPALKNGLDYDHARYLISEDFAPLGLATKDYQLLLTKKAVRLLQLPETMAGQPFDLTDLWKAVHFFSPESGVPVPFEKNPILESLQTGKPVVATLNLTLSNAVICKLTIGTQPLTSKLANSPLSVLISFSKHSEFRLAGTNSKTAPASGEKSDELLWLMNRKQQILFCNNKFRAVFAIPANYKGENLASLVPAEFLHPFKQLTETALANKDAASESHFFYRSRGNGERFVISALPVDQKIAENLVVFKAKIEHVEQLEKPLPQPVDRGNSLIGEIGGFWEWHIAEGSFSLSDRIFQLLEFERPHCSTFFWWYRRIAVASRNALNEAIRHTLLNGSGNFSQEIEFDAGNNQWRKVLLSGFIIYENGLPSRIIGSLLPLNRSTAGNPGTEERLKLAESLLLAAEKERLRTAKWLKQDLTETITTVKLYLEMLKPEETGQILKSKAIDYLSSTLCKIREISLAFQSADPSEDLNSVVKRIAKEVSEFAQLQVCFSSMGNGGFLPLVKRNALISIVQLQVENILAHAHATIATVALNWCLDGVEVEVADNGRGFEPEEVYQGSGFAGIFNLAAFHGGKVNLDAQPGKGTRLFVKMLY